MFHEKHERRAFAHFLRGASAKLRDRKLLGKGSARDGQALVEVALIVPLVFLLVVLAVNFGGFIYDWIAVANAARAAADYQVLGGSSWSYPPTASAANLQAIVANEASTLPHSSASNPSLAVCENNNAVLTVITGNCSNPPAVDPEAPLYVSVSVDVTYTYTPFISVFSFSPLGIGLPTMPATIHRHTVMRMLQ